MILICHHEVKAGVEHLNFPRLLRPDFQHTVPLALICDGMIANGCSLKEREQE